MSTEFRMSKMVSKMVSMMLYQWCYQLWYTNMVSMMLYQYVYKWCIQIDTTGPRSPLWLFADCIGAISEIHQDLSLDPYGSLWIPGSVASCAFNRFQQLIWFTDLHMIYIWSTFQLPFLRRCSCLMSFFVVHLLVHITDIYNWYAELCWTMLICFVQLPSFCYIPIACEHCEDPWAPQQRCHPPVDLVATSVYSK